MNRIYVMALVAAIAGFGGAWAHGLIRDAGRDGGDGATAETGGADLLREQIADLQREVRSLKNPPATLGATALMASKRDQDALVEAVLAKVDARVDERVTAQLGDMESKKIGNGSGTRTPRRGRKRLSLADAARELELSGAEEDELRRVFDESMSRFVKLAAGPDGDVETVKRELEAMRKDPVAGRSTMMKYVPNIMKNVGEIMTIAAEREAAVVKAIGADKARRLNSEFNVAEANPMGGAFGGGGLTGRR